VRGETKICKKDKDTHEVGGIAKTDAVDEEILQDTKQCEDARFESNNDK